MSKRQNGRIGSGSGGRLDELILSVGEHLGHPWAGPGYLALAAYAVLAWLALRRGGWVERYAVAVTLGLFLTRHAARILGNAFDMPDLGYLALTNALSLAQLALVAVLVARTRLTWPLFYLAFTINRVLCEAAFDLGLVEPERWSSQMASNIWGFAALAVLTVGVVSGCRERATHPAGALGPVGATS